MRIERHTEDGKPKSGWVLNGSVLLSSLSNYEVHFDGARVKETIELADTELGVLVARTGKAIGGWWGHTVHATERKYGRVDIIDLVSGKVYTGTK